MKREDEAARAAAVVEALLPRLRSMCANKRVRLPPGAELDDLVNEAALRLQAAVGRWDPERLALEAWATGCLRRCVVEACRALWPVSGYSVRQYGAAERATEQLGRRLGRDPTMAELGEHLGCSEDKARRRLARPYNPADVGVVDLADVDADPGDALDRNRRRLALRAVLEAEDATWLLTVVDAEGVRARAAALGCTDRTVRRQRARALARVRERMRGNP